MQILDIQNLRITYVPAADRAESANWAGTDVIRVQAYRDSEENQSLHMGAELPIPTPEVFGLFISALCQVYIEGRG